MGTILKYHLGMMIPAKQGEDPKKDLLLNKYANLNRQIMRSLSIYRYMSLFFTITSSLLTVLAISITLS